MDTIADWPTNGELIAEQVRLDPAFRSEWERTSVGRDVATALVRYRAEHDLSQRDLADQLGMTPPHIARLELGEVNPRKRTLVRLASQLGITLDGK